MERWHGKIAIVTGASSGIGWAIARALIDAGMYVIGLARRQALMQQLAEQAYAGRPLDFARFHARECDLNNLRSIQDAFEWIASTFDGHLHVLINNAGMAAHSLLLDAGNEAALQRVIDVNLMGTVHCTKQAFPLMEHTMRDSAAACHIINVNSLLGHRVPAHIPACGFNLYPVAKHALLALNEVLRRELAPHKQLLRLSTISPGLTRTEFGAVAAANGTAPDSPIDCASFPDFGGEQLSPEDVARGVCFILGSPQHVNVVELTMVPSCEEY